MHNRAGLRSSRQKWFGLHLIGTDWIDYGYGTLAPGGAQSDLKQATGFEAL